jgi:DNA-binding CsgD family transcriptional regulator
MAVDSNLDYLIDLAFSAAMRGSGWEDFLHQLAQVLRAERIGLFRQDLASGMGVIEEAAGIEPDFRSSYAALHGNRNIWFRAEAILAPGTVALGAELAPVWELIRSDFYRDWLRPQGALHAVIGVVERSAARMRCLIALRRREAGEFELGDCRIVAELVPHLRRATGFAAQLRQERRRSSILTELINGVPEAILLVDREYHVHLQNLAAGELLAQGDGLRCIGGRVCATTPEENRRLRELVTANVCATGKSAVILITRPVSASCALLVTVSPVAACLADDEIPLVALSTRDPARSNPLSVAQLCRLLPLTRTEAELAALILRRHELQEAAAILHISKNTARTHMKRIYAKTDLHRQPDLQRLLEASVFDPVAPASARPISHHPQR